MTTQQAGLGLARQSPRGVSRAHARRDGPLMYAWVAKLWTQSPEALGSEVERYELKTSLGCQG